MMTLSADYENISSTMAQAARLGQTDVMYVCNQTVNHKN